MEEVKDKQEMKKTQVFNVIILDRSGSMESIRQAAVEGFNETLAGIKKAQETFAETQDHFVSLVTFCSCETKHVFDKTLVADAHPLKMEDFQQGHQYAHELLLTSLVHEDAGGRRMRSTHVGRGAAQPIYQYGRRSF